MHLDLSHDYSGSEIHNHLHLNTTALELLDNYVPLQNIFNKLQIKNVFGNFLVSFWFKINYRTLVSSLCSMKDKSKINYSHIPILAWHFLNQMNSADHSTKVNKWKIKQITSKHRRTCLPTSCQIPREFIKKRGFVEGIWRKWGVLHGCWSAGACEAWIGAWVHIVY